MSIKLYWLIKLATILLEQTFLLFKCSVYGGQTEESIGNMGNWLLLDSGAEQKSRTNEQ